MKKHILNISCEFYLHNVLQVAYILFMVGQQEQRVLSERLAKQSARLRKFGPKDVAKKQEREDQTPLLKKYCASFPLLLTPLVNDAHLTSYQLVDDTISSLHALHQKTMPCH